MATTGWTSEATGESDGGRLWYRWTPSGEEGAGDLTVGVTLLTTDTLGEIERVTLPEEGDNLTKGDILFEVEGTLDSYEWASLFSMTVVEVNHGLLEEPELLNEDPQDAGWLVRLELQDENDLNALLRESRSRGSDEDEDDEEEEDELLEDDEAAYEDDAE